MIVSVAMDADPEAARPWIEAASPEYVTLIDRDHLVSDLYNMVNVPQAVWIDESGRVVRPVETGGSVDILREFDPEIGGFPEASQEKAARAKALYVEAVKDWAIKGRESRFVVDPEAVAAAQPLMTDEVALAHTKFKLGQYLSRHGRADEAAAVFAECRTLHPDSWNMFRETTERMDTGIAAGQEFWEKVMSLGDKQYYASINMPGMPE